MTFCSICPEPGRCCRKFCLNHENDGRWEALTFFRDSWREDAAEHARQQGHPFAPLEIIEHDPILDTEGRERVMVWWTCPKLTPEGRCGTYADRPRLCRTFVPGTNGLCAFGDLSAPIK